MTIICTTCKEDKEVSFFSKDISKAQGYRTICKECENKKSRERYKNNKEKYKKIEKDKRARNRKENMKRIVELTNLTCSWCGFQHTSTAPFAWHHIDATTKDYDVSTLMRLSNKEKLEEELEKCVFICHNCHDIEHERLREEEGK